MILYIYEFCVFRIYSSLQLLHWNSGKFQFLQVANGIMIGFQTDPRYEAWVTWQRKKLGSYAWTKHEMIPSNI